MLLSVIIPCFNEEAVLRATHERLTSVLSGMDQRYELIFIDDGSRDNTQQILAELQLFDPH
ncbi:MAG TPA: glycosyltransferase, partial [Pyrinomonadaceae bacterium]